ncbi:MAG: AraC family transcriptional regulator [Anaerolineaceae bacterium]|nr:AraC family transcriptional regulator [Anaerolineaceae bacterium]
MTSYFEARASDSSYVYRIWRGHFDEDNRPVCPANTHWNLLFLRKGSQVRVAAEGPLTQALTKFEAQDSEFLVIQLEAGVYMPHLPPDDLANSAATLPQAAGERFWLKGASWQMPTFDNVETFAERLVRQGLLERDPVVHSVLNGQRAGVSERTIRRHFLHGTGMTLNIMQQIERARQAANLIEKWVPLVEVALQAGYADQAHMTRSLRRYFGQTPTQLLHPDVLQLCPICSRPGLMLDLCSCCHKQAQTNLRSVHYA